MSGSPARLRAPRAIGAWLALGLGLLCLLTAGGSMTTTDAVVAYEVTRSLVERGAVDTGGDRLGNDAYRGQDGRYFSPFGIAQSVWNVPFYLAGRTLARRVDVRSGRGDTIQKAVVALATVPAVALLACVGFEMLMTLGASPAGAVRTVLLLVVATPLWPYSGFGFNQPLTALCLWGAVLGALAARTHPRALLGSGLCAGVALLTRHEMIGAALIIAAYVAVQGGPRRIAAVTQYAIGLLPGVAVWAGLNWWRFGNPLESGYLRDTTPGFGGSIVSGGAGLLFSPYASLFLYCPIAVIAVPAFRHLHRRDRAAATLFAALFVSYFVLYASLGNWMGGRSYGPRYLVPLLPALVLPLAFWQPRGWRRAVVAAVVVLSVAVQIPGVLVDYSKVRMERAAAGETVAQDNRWAAAPLLLNARALAVNAPRAVEDLTAGRPAPPVNAGAQGLSAALGFSLDLWWLYLFYLRVIGPSTAVGIALALALGSAGAIWRAFVVARRWSS